MVKFAPLRVPRERRLQTLCIATTINIIYGGFIAALTLAYLLFFTNYYWISLIYLSFMYGEGDIACRGSRPLNWVRNLALWKYCRDYFPVKLVKTTDLDPSKNYLLCVFPHGLIPVGVVLGFGTEALGVSKLFPGIKHRVATVNLMFKLPILRDLIMAAGFCSVSKGSLNYLLDSRVGTGNATVIVPGGTAEMLRSKRGSYKAVLKNRKGFIRLAITNGASLVPMISFGENDVFDQWANPEGSLLRKIQDYLRKVTGLPLVIPFGRGVFQYSYGLLPHRLPVTTVVGAPIHVDQVEEPTIQQVDELHEEFMNALVTLFETEKHKYIQNPDETFLIIE